MYVHIFAANVCNTISVCCQLNFQVVSDHTRPCKCVRVYECVCECVRVCMSSIPYLAVYLSVFICRFVCLAVVFNCIQILFLLVVGVKSIRGSRVEEGKGRGQR